MKRQNRAVRDARVVASFSDGMSPQEIAQKLHLRSCVVYSAIRAAGLSIRKVNEDRDASIVAEYEAGANSQQLADKYGVSRERICQVLRKVNIIEHRAERRRLAKEALKDEADALRAAAKAEFDQKISAGVELVRSGHSMNDAARILGLSATHKQYQLAKACKAAGVASIHGRWRDFEPQKLRIRELREQGKSWREVISITRAEGYGTVNYPWIVRHMQDLVKHRGPVSDVPQVVSRRKPKDVREDPDMVWTPDRVATLVDLWFRGSSAAQCADILGPPITRNAVIGKINRLREAGKLMPRTTSEAAE